LNNNSLFIHLYELHVSQSTSYMKSLKISKGSSECIYGRRTDNTMIKRKDANRQTTIYKPYTYIYHDTHLILYIMTHVLRYKMHIYLSHNHILCYILYDTCFMLYIIWHMFYAIYLWFLFIGFPFNTFSRITSQ
jgi:hypothetical protein